MNEEGTGTFNDDELKKKYVDSVVKKCPHGLVLWNPHSGASDVIEWECNSADEVPLTSPGNKVLRWWTVNSEQ